MRVYARIMTPDDRHRALLTLIAARLADEAAQQAIKRSCIGYGRVSPPTVNNVLHGKNHKLSTLIEIADSLDCDVEITITKRSA